MWKKSSQLTCKPVDQEEIRAFYEDNKDSYQQPATHQMQVLTIDKDQLLQDIKAGFSEEELKAFFAEQGELFGTSETRDILQFRMNADANSDDVIAQIKANTPMDNVEGAIGLKLDARSRESLPLDVADTVFALSEGEVSAPITTALGQLIFKVERIIPPVTPLFDDVVDEIRAQLAENLLPERLDGMFNEIDDMVASGTKLSDITNIPGVTLDETTLEQAAIAQGLGTDDASIIDLVVTQLPGDEPLGFVRDDLVPVFVSKLAVTDARPATFDEVREQVAKDASAAKTRDVREQAITEGLGNFAGLDPQTKNRVELSQIYPPNFVARMLSEDDPQVFRISDDQAVLIKVSSLSPGDSEPTQALVDAVSSELIGEGQNDLLDELIKRENPQILVGNLEQALSRFSQ